jgi:uncharacterized protein
MLKAIARIAEEVKERFLSEGSGHDWWHIQRVRSNAVKLARQEGGDPEITELAALLHDIADHKFHGGSLEAGPLAAREILEREGIPGKVTERVIQIIREVSFKGAGVETPCSSLESACVQDADRLDAIGAIGIARAFAYGGSRGRLLYEPGVSPENHANFEAYRSSQGHTINHFHEKLLLLKDRMQTGSGRKMALERHLYMEDFLRQFHEEWGI